MPDYTLEVLKTADAILHDRGWHHLFSAGAGGKLNIRSAISAACTKVVRNNSEWHPAYRQAVKTLSLYLKDGVSSWEFGTHSQQPRRRTEQEVFELFSNVIARLESENVRKNRRGNTGGRVGTL